MAQASSLTPAPGPLPGTCSSCSLTPGVSSGCPLEAELPRGWGLDFLPPAGALLGNAASHILLQPPVAGDMCFVISI